MGGTEIKQMKGGRMVRVVSADGKEFPLEANKAVYKHLKSLGIEVEEPQQQGNSSKPKKEKTEKTPEEQVAYQMKMAEKHQQRIAREGRVMAGNNYMMGEIVDRAGSFFWVKANNQSAIPGAVMSKLRAMNNEARAKNPKFLGGKDVLAIYVAMGDIAIQGLSLKAGTKVKFKLYTDTKGVSGCEVMAA